MALVYTFADQNKITRKGSLSKWNKAETKPNKTEPVAKTCHSKDKSISNTED